LKRPFIEGNGQLSFSGFLRCYLVGKKQFGGNEALYL
jgi:hypothetical protein